MVREASHKLVITLPIDVYFKLKDMGEPLPVKSYIELLLRNIAVREIHLGSLKTEALVPTCLDSRSEQVSQSEKETRLTEDPPWICAECGKAFRLVPNHRQSESDGFSLQAEPSGRGPRVHPEGNRYCYGCRPEITCNEKR